MNEEEYLNLADFGKTLLNSKKLDDGLPIIASYACDIIDAERCSIFVYDERASKLWTTLADGIERITIDADKGIVGQTLKSKALIIENDVEQNPYFLKEIDNSSGFTTQNIIAMPIFDSNQEVIGVLELLNKQGGFENKDRTFIRFFANFINSFIEVAPRREPKN